MQSAGKIRKLEFEEIFNRQPNLFELKDLPRLPIYTLADNIRSMHNVGSIFRTSDGVRIAKLFLTGYSARPPRKEIEKTALGATDSVPWEYSADPLPVIKRLKERGIRIVVLEHTTHSVPYTETDYEFPLCIVVGNEVDGVSQQVVEEADMAVELPMLGLKQSLNVSVAYGIISYHILFKYLINNALKP